MPTFHVPQAFNKQHLHTVKVCSTTTALLLLLHFRPTSVAVWIEDKGKNTYMADAQPLSPSGISQTCTEQETLLSIEDNSHHLLTGCCSVVQYLG